MKQATKTEIANWIEAIANAVAFIGIGILIGMLLS